jgi:flavin-dependent dehydrogenase
MAHFDVIVIGGGPAGCYAALAAAARKCRVALFEEHGAIGWPRHDPGWLMETDFTRSLLQAFGKSIAWSTVQQYKVCRSEDGTPLEASTHGGYLVRRDILEKEIAGHAIRAGATFYLNTKVLRLLSSGAGVEGVETGSSVIPTATAEVIICADGIRSAGSGFAVGEGLCNKTEPRAGLSYLLSNADVSPGVIEHFLSSEAALNYKTFFTHGNGFSFFGARSSGDFDDLRKRTDNAVSRKISNACPIEVTGFWRSSPGKYAEYFKTISKGNILFVGDASGGAGNIHGMIQGQFAGKVAASAIRDHDVTEGRLSEYSALVFDTLGKAPFYYYSAREDFGSFDNWFRTVDHCTEGLKPAELTVAY